MLNHSLQIARGTRDPQVSDELLDGELYYNKNSNKLFIGNNGTLINIQGPKGDKGDTGPQGPKGDSEAPKYTHNINLKDSTPESLISFILTNDSANPYTKLSSVTLNLKSLGFISKDKCAPCSGYIKTSSPGIIQGIYSEDGYYLKSIIVYLDGNISTSTILYNPTMMELLVKVNDIVK